MGTKGEKERGQTAGQATEHTAGAGEEGKRREGRKGRGTRMASRLGSGERNTAAGERSRERTDRQM